MWFCRVRFCRVRNGRSVRCGDGGERRAYGRSKKQAALTGGLFVSVIGVFIGGNFSGSAEMAQRWRWLSAGDGSALFGNERICTVSALVRGGAALAAEPGIKALQPVPGRGGREKFPCRVFRFGGRAVKYRFSRCECEVFAAVLAAGQILHPEVKRRIAAAFA